MNKLIKPQPTYNVKQTKLITKEDPSRDLSWEDLVFQRNELVRDDGGFVLDSELTISVDASYDYCVDLYFVWHEEKPNLSYKKQLKEFLRDSERYNEWKVKEIARLEAAKKTVVEHAKNRIQREQEKLDRKLARLQEETDE